jgi:hypothetical protein
MEPGGADHQTYALGIKEARAERFAPNTLLLPRHMYMGCFMPDVFVVLRLDVTPLEIYLCIGPYDKGHVACLDLHVCVASLV